MMRIKRTDENNKSYRCCFNCIHVRTGTITFGIVQMFLQLLVLFALIMSVVYPDFNSRLQPIDNETYLKYNVTNYNGTPVQKSNSGYDFVPLGMHANETLGNRCVAFGVSLFSILISLMMVLGALKRKPGYLMPHFILQVFDFTLTCLSVIGYFTYSPNIKTFVASKVQEPSLRAQVLSMDEATLALIVMTLMVSVLFFKAYLIGMVWDCYQFLVQQSRPAQPTETGDMDPDSQMLLPPKYEEIYETGSGYTPVYVAREGSVPPAYTA